MWQAMGVVGLLQVVLLGVAVARFDWRLEVERAREGVEEGTRSMGDIAGLGGLSEPLGGRDSGTGAVSRDEEEPLLISSGKD